MKNFFAYVSLFVFAAAVAPPIGSAGTTNTATAENAAGEDEIRRLNKDEVQAFVHNDPKEMARVWSDDLVVTNPLNKLVNKQQILGMVTSGFPGHHFV